MRVDAHELDAGGRVDLVFRHTLQHIGHRGHVAFVAIVVGVLDELHLLAKERVIDAPRVDADAGQRHVARGRKPGPHLVPQPCDIPVERVPIGNRLVGEAVNFADGQRACAQLAGDRAAALGAEVEGKIGGRLHRNRIMPHPI